VQATDDGCCEFERRIASLRESGTQSAETVLVQLIGSLASAHERAVHLLRRDLEQWEFRFFFRAADPDADTSLVSYLSRIRLSGLGAAAARLGQLTSDLREVEFEAVGNANRAVPVDSLRDQSLAIERALNGMRAELRSAFDLIANTAASQQLELAHAEQRRSQSLQTVLALIAAVLLMPSLIAGVFGANVGFADRDTAAAFTALVLLMAASVPLTFVVIRVLEGVQILPRSRRLAVVLVAIGAVTAIASVYLAAESQGLLTVAWTAASGGVTVSIALSVGQLLRGRAKDGASDDRVSPHDAWRREYARLRNDLQLSGQGEDSAQE